MNGWLILIIIVGCFILGYIISMIVWYILNARKEALQPVMQIPHLNEEVKVEQEKLVLFTLSRSDVLDHILEMQNDRMRFPIKPVVKEKTDEKSADFLMCGNSCFCMMFDRNDIVFNLILNMSDEMAKASEKRYIIHKVSSLNGDNWYNLTINRAFENKKEVYNILDNCYDYVSDDPQDIKDEVEKVKIELAILQQKLSDNYEVIEKTTAEVERNYKLELEKFKQENYTKFLITRKEIAEDTKALNNVNITVIERDKNPQMPMSLKYKDKTYAMLYGTDIGVIMIVRISEAYANVLSFKHPEICRAKFPKGANWYYIPVDGAFANKDAVYSVLYRAIEFVEEKYTKKIEEKKLSDEKKVNKKKDNESQKTK